MLLSEGTQMAPLTPPLFLQTRPELPILLFQFHPYPAKPGRLSPGDDWIYHPDSLPGRINW